MENFPAQPPTCQRSEVTLNEAWEMELSNRFVRLEPVRAIGEG